MTTIDQKQSHKSNKVKTKKREDMMMTSRYAYIHLSKYIYNKNHSCRNMRMILRLRTRRMIPRKNRELKKRLEIRKVNHPKKQKKQLDYQRVGVTERLLLMMS